MIIFLLEFLLIGVLWFVFAYSEDKTFKRCLQIVAYSSILFLTCFRSTSIDPDTPMYVNYFKLINALPWSQVFTFGSFEVGDVLLFKLIGSIWLNERFFLIAMACITTIPLFIFIDKQSKNVFLSLSIFLAMDFWFGTIFLMRQYAALGFCLLAYSSLRKEGIKSFFFFFFFVCLAFLFHQSSIFFMPVYFLKFFKKGSTMLAVFLPIFLLFLIFGNRIVNILNNFSRISYVVKYSGGATLLIFLFLIAGAIPLFSPSFLGANSSNRLLYAMLIYTILIQVLALSMGNMTRAAKYTMVSVIVLVPNYLDHFCRKKENKGLRPMLSSFAFLAFGAFFLVSLLHNNNSIQEYMFM